jgi:YidC/Oxa1 family membrane protein insertase
MFDGLFEVIAKTLSFFYDAIPNYAVAIALLTLVVMVITTPFTLKGTRSMIQMQRLQPEMRRIQLKYKDDRQKQNEELMAFYKENQLNPLGGCLPMILQMPVFLILFQVLKGLTHLDPDGRFTPKYLDRSDVLYRSLHGSEKMLSFGVDLAESSSKALSESFGHALPHLFLVAIVAATSYYQQKQIQGRNPNAEIPPQQKMLMRIFPAMFVFFAFISPSALVVYFVTSNLYRIGMQAYITRTLYGGDDSLGAQAQRAAQESKRLKEEHGSPNLLPQLGKKGREARAGGGGGASGGNSSPSGSDPSPNGSDKKPTPPRARTGAQNRSKKKKRKRR